MDIFSKNLFLLKELFPNQIDATKEGELRKIFHDTESSWSKNLTRFKVKEIKYLLICEAPPESGKYFYNNFERPLFTTVWKTFFDSPKCVNSEDAYKCLANEGFLLIDTLPYSMDYSQNRKIRKSEVYKKLIKECLPWWLEKLNNNFNFAPVGNLKIAFGFKLNAETIINETNGKISLKTKILKGSKLKEYKIDNNQIVADGLIKWQPSIKLLENTFDTAKSKKNCLLS